MNGLKCFKCSALVRGGTKQLKTHFSHMHALILSNTQEDFVCAQNNCRRSYSRFSLLANHISKWHSVDDARIANEQNDVSDEDDILEPEVLIEAEDMPLQHEIIEEEPVVNEQQYFSQCTAELVCNLRSKSSMTNSSINYALEGCNLMVSHTASFLRKEVIKFFDNYNVDKHSPEAKDLLSKFDINIPSEKFQSLAHQTSYFEMNMGLVSPIEVPLGNRIDQVLNPSTADYQPKAVMETFQYVPIIKVLELIFSKKRARQELLTERRSNDGFIRSFVDATQYDTHPFLARYPQTIRLQLYYDDLEVTNPLGSKTTIHKIGAFYYTIQNFPPEFNSVLNNIHLLTICHTVDIKKYGFKRILAPFLEDLQKLESDNGVVINCDGNEDNNFTIRAVITSVCADGLAIHELFGFLGPSCNRFCRQCMVTRAQLHAQTDNSLHERRTKELYEEHVELVTIQRVPNIHTETGLRENSVLNDSKYFHCTNNFVFDAMHDLLEGVCEFELKLVLNHFVIIEKYFTVNLFNQRLKMFKYGFPERRNKPSPNFAHTSLRNLTDHSLKQKAMQMWLLIRAFPFLISDKVDENSMHLKLILLLLRIMEIVFAPKITIGLLSYLSDLIKEHHSLKKELFPEINFINKDHHLEHYPECMAMVGPMVRLWCMRYEAKHAPFKRHASVCCNFKNIPKTMAQMNQISQCSVWGKNKDGFRKKVDAKTGEICSVRMCTGQDYLIGMNYDPNDIIFSSSSLFYYGTEYRLGLLVCTQSHRLSEKGLPVFAKIKEILVLPSDDTHLVVSLWDTLYFESKYNAFCVSPREEQIFVGLNIEELPDFHPLAPWTDYTDEKLYVSLRNVVL